MPKPAPPELLANRHTGGRPPGTWNGGKWGRRQKQRYLALLEITGKPSVASKMMDELELWDSDLRPSPTLMHEWNQGWHRGDFEAPPKIMQKVQTLYDAHRRSDMDATIHEANKAHRHISQSVVEDKFNKDVSGVYQHAGQFIAIGSEKRSAVYEKRPKDDVVQMSPQFFLMAPPERKVIEGEVVKELPSGR